MALLILLFLYTLVAPVSEAAYPTENVSKTVLFDSAQPQNSVGKIGNQFVEAGDDYEKYEVMGFEPRRILLKDHSTFEVIKLPAEDRLNAKDMIEARHRFVVKQLRAIYDAQVAYIAKYRDHYARDLEALIKEGLLPDGFSEGMKQDYFFRVTKTEQDFNKEPKFFVRASPVKSIQPDSFFSVDQLGLIRFADTVVQLPWGPVWDYADHGEPKNEYIGTEKRTA